MVAGVVAWVQRSLVRVLLGPARYALWLDVEARQQKGGS